MKSSLSDLQTVSRRINALSLFSDNESLEDVATKDLVYMFVPYVKGEVIGKLRTQGVEERMKTLKEAKVCLGTAIIPTGKRPLKRTSGW